MDKSAQLTEAIAEAEATGVLPLTSTCNVACIFCSNRGNPPEVEVYRLPPRPLDDLERSLRNLGRPREIVIGESASRISEGEPLTHPAFRQVIGLIRRLHPATPIKLTTNGTLLDAGTVRALAEAAPLEVTLSLNTTDPGGYDRLHGRPHDPRPVLELLGISGVPYHASVVAVPAVTGSEDLLRTARLLADRGCLSCRVFAPGYTRHTPAEIVELLPTRDEVARLVERARSAGRLPLTLEPPLTTDLDARIAGILCDSSAERVGLVSGDVIEAVDGRPPFSRVEAFTRTRQALRRRGRCLLALRGGREVTLQGRGRPGFIVDRDVDPADVRLILAEGLAYGARRVVVVTSELGLGPLALGLERAAEAGGHPDYEVVLMAVPSKTFGGSIASAGLLTIADIATAIRDEWLDRLGPLGPDDLILLPPLAFSRTGRDLRGARPADLTALLPSGARAVVAGQPGG